MLWRGWVTLAPGRLTYGGQVGPASMHAHHAVQLLIGPDLVLRGADGVDHRCDAALIPANTPHAIVRGAEECLLALVDPVAAAGRLPLPAVGPPGSAAAWRLSRDRPPEAIFQELLDGGAPASPTVAEAVDLIPRLLPGQVRLGDVARAVHLSESRLGHLFRAELGLPFRPYVLWVRLHRAVSSLAGGLPLTDAAHAAGFADAAHMTRAFRRMFGGTPSELSRGVRWVDQQVRSSHAGALPPTLGA